MGIQLIDRSTAFHRTWGEGCESWVLADETGLTVKLEAMAPGTSESMHLHQKAQQLFVIMQGTATFYSAEQVVNATARQSVHVPAGTPHRIANEGDEPLEFLIVSQPGIQEDRIEL